MVWHGGHLQSSIFIFILTYAVAYSRVNIATSLQHTVVAGLNHSWTPSPRYFPVGLATTPSPKRKHPSRTPWSPCMYVCNGGPDVSRHAGKTKSGYAAWRAGEDRGRDGGSTLGEVTPGLASGIRASVFGLAAPPSLACLPEWYGWLSTRAQGTGWIGSAAYCKI